MTKATLAVVTTLGALVGGGYAVPIALLVGMVLPGAISAKVAWRVTRLAFLLSLPISISVALVSVFTRPGETVLFVVGPFDATREGVDFAVQVIVRLFVMAAALALFGLTTPPRAIVTDLERRGVSPRLAFALGSVIGAIPALVERARDVQAAQRSRGLDTEGSLSRRIGGVLPLVGPVMIGSLHDVEARSLALDARAFGRPGPRHLLWAPRDDDRERAVRWLLLSGLLFFVAASATGFIPRLP